MPYTYQPSTANYCFYHEDGYRVCVGDGKKPSQLKGDRRKQKPHGVPILLKIKDKPNPVAEAQKKKAAKIRKKEYDRLYAAANRKLKNPEKKTIKDKALIEKVSGKRLEYEEEDRLERKREFNLLRQQRQKEAKKKLEKLKATNDKLKAVREKKDNKEKQLAITKYESKWNNTDRAKEFKKKMDGIKAQKDGEAKKKALAKVKKDEKAAKDKHIEIKKKSILVLQSDIDKLEKEEDKAYGVALIKQENKREEVVKDFKRERAAKKIQKVQKERIKRKKELRQKTKEIIEKAEKEMRIQGIIDDYNETYLPFKAIVLANKDALRGIANEGSYLARMVKFARADKDYTINEYKGDNATIRGNEIRAMKDGIERVERKIAKYNKKKAEEAEKERLEILEKERLQAQLDKYKGVEKELIKVQSVIRKKIKTRYGALPQKVRLNMAIRDNKKYTDEVIDDYEKSLKKIEKDHQKNIDKLDGDPESSKYIIELDDLEDKKERAEKKALEKVKDRYNFLEQRRRDMFKQINGYDAGKRGFGGMTFSLFVSNLERKGSEYGIKEVKREHNNFKELLEKMENQFGVETFNNSGKSAEKREEEYDKEIEKIKVEEAELGQKLKKVKEKMKKHKKSSDKTKYKQYKKLDKKLYSEYSKKGEQLINSIKEGYIVKEDYKPFDYQLVYDLAAFGIKS